MTRGATTTAWRRRLRRGDDAGFTVIELMVVTMIMLIVSFVLFGFLDSTSRVTSRQANQTEAENAGTLAMRRMTEDIRSATSITACSTVSYSSCVSFSVPAQGPSSSCPERTVTYQLTGAQVTESQVTYSSSCVATTTISNLALVSSAANDSSHPLFTYYDSSQNQIDVVSQASSVPKAAAVLVTLQISYTGDSNLLTLSNLVALRNNR